MEDYNVWASFNNIVSREDGGGGAGSTGDDAISAVDFCARRLRWQIDRMNLFKKQFWIELLTVGVQFLLLDAIGRGSKNPKSLLSEKNP